MRRVVIAKSAEEMRKLRPGWERIYCESDHTLFQRYGWNELAAQFFAEREQPFAVMAEDDSGIAIIPAAINIKKRQLTLLGEELFDYRDVLWRGGESALESAWSAVLSFAAERGLAFAMQSLRRESSSGEVPELSWQAFEVSPFTQAPCARREDAGRKLHSRLGRNLRRLECLGCELKMRRGNDSALVRIIYDAKSQQGGSLFADPIRMAMVTAMINAAGDDCEIFTLESGATLVAALVTFIDGQWRRLYTTYHDENPAWAKYSPGLSLIHSVMEESLASGFDCDFMTGDQPYKRRLATSAVPLYKVSASVETLAERAGALAPAKAA
jgi:CelD/BcsL family acetyltransferase involved in cellulose biosynthesis